MRGMSYIHPSTPSFLSAFKAQLTGGPAPDAEGKYDPTAQQAVDAGGRAALPGGRGDRQTSEDREKDDRERERDEDEWGFGEGEEAPQVVVVKEGRHLTQLDMDNERRRGAHPINTTQSPFDSSWLTIFLASDMRLDSQGPSASISRLAIILQARPQLSRVDIQTSAKSGRLLSNDRHRDNKDGQAQGGRRRRRRGGSCWWGEAEEGQEGEEGPAQLRRGGIKGGSDDPHDTPALDTTLVDRRAIREHKRLPGVTCS